jgi:chemotaxis protein CheD
LQLLDAEKHLEIKMSTVAVAKKTRIPMVGMGQIVTVAKPELAQAVLGSCIGLTLYHPRIRTGTLAHIVLPDSRGRSGPPGKFADTAIPHMVDLLLAEGANKHGITAKMVGGASMFAATGPMQVGSENAVAVKSLLSEMGIGLVGENIGGQKGRRVAFDPTDGSLTIEVVGEQTIVL